MEPQTTFSAVPVRLDATHIHFQILQGYGMHAACTVQTNLWMIVPKAREDEIHHPAVEAQATHLAEPVVHFGPEGSRIEMHLRRALG